jgi:hypothetical protein
MADAPRLRKIETIEDFEVWEVDGKHIRDKMDREFTNFGQHFRFPFIPQHEFWIDKEFGNDETKFFVDHMIIEWHLMKEGKSYSHALEKADEMEKNERKKYSKILEDAKGVKPGVLAKALPKEGYVEELAKNKGLAAWIVNGELVRDLYFIDFTEGGHHYVYNWVPFMEVWIDNDLNPEERYYVLLHELHERYLMYTGLTYPHAHHSSSIIEYKCRRDPSLLEQCLKEEIEKNNSIV